LQPLKAPVVFLERIGPFLLLLLVSGATLGISNHWKNPTITQSSEKRGISAVDELNADQSVSIQSITVSITPPSYTKQKKQVQTELSIKAIKGSSLAWELNFNKEEKLEVTLANVGGDEIPFKREAQEYVLNDQLTGSGVYAIRAYEDDSLVFESEYYPLEMYGDQPPVILPYEKDIYRYHFARDPKNYTMKAQVSDDFMVTEAFVVAT